MSSPFLQIASESVCHGDTAYNISVSDAQREILVMALECFSPCAPDVPTARQADILRRLLANLPNQENYSASGKQMLHGLTL